MAAFALQSALDKWIQNLKKKSRIWIFFRSPLSFPFQRLSGFGCNENEWLCSKQNWNPMKRALCIWKWEIGQNGKRCNCHNWKPDTLCNSFPGKRESFGNLNLLKTNVTSWCYKWIGWISGWSIEDTLFLKIQLKGNQITRRQSDVSYCRKAADLKTTSS